MSSSTSFVALLASLVAFADPASALTFDDAQRIALERAPLLGAKQAAVDAAASERISAGRLPDPRLVAGIDNYPIEGPNRFSTTRDFMTMRSLGWMQEMPNTNKRDARTQMASARIERERALLAAERLAVRREVARGWLARYFTQQRLDLFATLEKENRLLIDTVAARVAGGRAMPTDATAARQEAVQLADRRDELNRQLATAQASLRRWVGDAAGRPLTGEPPALAIDPTHLRDDIDRAAELAAFGPMADMARAEAREIEAAKKGDWSWQLTYSQRGEVFGDMVSVQFTFELPLAPRQRQDPLIAAKRKEAERIEAEREDMLRKHREEIEMRLAEHDELTRKLERLQASATPLAQERVSLAMAAYESARGDLGAVLAVRREQAELRLREIDLQAQRYALRAHLNYLLTEHSR